MATPRYMLFGGDAYYANGGAADLIAVGDDPTALVCDNLLITQDEIRKNGTAHDTVDWWYVLDLQDFTIISSGSCGCGHGVGDPPDAIKGVLASIFAKYKQSQTFRMMYYNQDVCHICGDKKEKVEVTKEEFDVFAELRVNQWSGDGFIVNVHEIDCGECPRYDPGE